MAPRGRPRKLPRGVGKGTMRMDAAIDAMRSYGFSDDLISGSIKELLDVYGDDGWPFIEEGCYEVLRETILEKVDAAEKGQLLIVGGDGDNTKELASGPLSRGIVPTCSDEHALVVEEESNVPLDNAVPIMMAPALTEPTDGSDHRPCLPHSGGEQHLWKDIDMDQDTRKQKKSSVEGRIVGQSHTVKEPTISSSLQPQEQVNTVPTRRRRPCYGWISGSDDEQVLIDTTKLFSVTEARKNLKSRWDVKP